MRLLSFMILAFLGAAPAQAAEAMKTVHSAVFIERESYAEGSDTRIVERATTLGRGDRVVTILDWQSPQDGKPATVTLAVPPNLTFQRSSTGDEEVSADKGRSWGTLGQLQIRDAYGLRLATPEDITNVRWRVNGPNGRISYSALVR
ncbi:hypothetical protein MB02_04805 [Croceicoccus estronivorus]|uniref:hypothetical protein n=1 Tax=Croceicoccus estronivorus TaxID=1172626 RepID=UPI000833B214|nr:hypothetical protein [Croceicoccus estronivorus]OCC24793.1 hypothetical protein MB02_04805 [Croceicoccus estronivorus]